VKVVNVERLSRAPCVSGIKWLALWSS